MQLTAFRTGIYCSLRRWNHTKPNSSRHPKNEHIRNASFYCRADLEGPRMSIWQLHPYQSTASHHGDLGLIVQSSIPMILCTHVLNEISYRNFTIPWQEIKSKSNSHKKVRFQNKYSPAAKMKITTILSFLTCFIY